MRISDWSSDVCSSDLGQHRIEQAGEPAVEFFPAQLVHVRRALAARAHDPGVPQHAEMMRHTGLGQAAVERRADRLALAVELAHDVEATRVAQGVAHPGQLARRGLRMAWLPLRLKAP